jgi:acetyl esterase/lipase
MLLENNNASSSDLSPELLPIDKEHPRAFVAQNADDPAAHPQNSLVYSRALLGVGQTPTLHLYPTGGHGFGLCQRFAKFEEVCDWTQAMRRFLQDRGAAPGFPKSRDAPPCARVTLTEK